MAPLSPESVAVRYASRGQLLSNSRAAGSVLSLFVPSETFPAVGSEVRLVISLADCGLHYELVGKVQVHRTYGRQPGQSAGIAVVFEKEHKRAAAQMLAECAGRPKEQGSARTPRVEKRLPCRLEVGRRRVPAQVLDLSVGGAFVSAPKGGRVEVGAEVVLELRRGFLGIWTKRIPAKVVWLGHKHGAGGFGARFTAPQEEVVPAIRRYLA